MINIYIYIYIYIFILATIHPTQGDTSQAGPGTGAGVSEIGDGERRSTGPGAEGIRWDPADYGRIIGPTKDRLWSDHWSYKNYRDSAGGFERPANAAVPVNPMLDDWDRTDALRAELINRGYETPYFVSADDGRPFEFVFFQVTRPVLRTMTCPG